MWYSMSKYLERHRRLLLSISNEAKVQEMWMWFCNIKGSSPSTFPSSENEHPVVTHTRLHTSTYKHNFTKKQYTFHQHITLYQNNAHCLNWSINYHFTLTPPITSHNIHVHCKSIVILCSEEVRYTHKIR